MAGAFVSATGLSQLSAGGKHYDPTPDLHQPRPPDTDLGEAGLTRTLNASVGIIAHGFVTPSCVILAISVPPVDSSEICIYIGRQLEGMYNNLLKAIRMAIILFRLWPN